MLESLKANNIFIFILSLNVNIFLYLYHIENKTK